MLLSRRALFTLGAKAALAIATAPLIKYAVPKSFQLSLHEIVAPVLKANRHKLVANLAASNTFLAEMKRRRA